MNGQIISYEEYYPYGSTSYQAVGSGVEVSQKRYRYTGKERDEESGLYYHGARYYAPWLGRWTVADPAGMVDGPNLYRYSRNNPVVYNDPNGMDPPPPAPPPGRVLALGFYTQFLGPNRLDTTKVRLGEAKAATGKPAVTFRSLGPIHDEVWNALGSQKGTVVFKVTPDGLFQPVRPELPVGFQSSTMVQHVLAGKATTPTGAPIDAAHFTTSRPEPLTPHRGRTFSSGTSFSEANCARHSQPWLPNSTR